MVRIFFSEPLPQLPHVVPLAQACGVGRSPNPEASLARLFAEAPALWQVSAIEDADLAAYSNHYDGRTEAMKFVRRAGEAGLKTLLFDNTDNHFVPRPPDESAVVWRTAIYADKMQPWERAMPAPCEDLWRGRGGRPVFRKKSQTPSIGFCGYISPLWKNLARMFRRDHEKVKGHVVRRRALNALKGSPRVRTDFVERPNYFGGALLQPDAIRAIREQFVANMLDNDYTLCARGAGNFSIRFYETLAAARIPVLVNTRCVLPFADVIDWKRHCLIVEESEMRQLPERVAEFHEKLTSEGFRSMQEGNRALWEEWLEPFAFTRRAVERALTASAG